MDQFKFTAKQLLEIDQAIAILDSGQLSVRGGLTLRRIKLGIKSEVKAINETYAAKFKENFGELKQADDAHPNWKKWDGEKDELMKQESNITISFAKLKSSDIEKAPPRGLVAALEALDWAFEAEEPKGE